MRSRNRLAGVRRFIHDWRAQWPDIATHLTTAFLLFLASLAFKPVRDWFFPDDAMTYPIICTADPVVDVPRQKLLVSFFIINRTKEEYTGEDLRGLLAKTAGSDASPSTDIVLRGTRGKIEAVLQDAAFNGDKAELAEHHDANAVHLRIVHIEPRAVLRVWIVVGQIPDLVEVERSAKGAIPIDYMQYQDACYQR